MFANEYVNGFYSRPKQVGVRLFNQLCVRRLSSTAIMVAPMPLNLSKHRGVEHSWLFRVMAFSVARIFLVHSPLIHLMPASREMSLDFRRGSQGVG